MIAELISVGTELLLGNIVNTNSNYLANEMIKIHGHGSYSNYFPTTSPHFC